MNFVLFVRILELLRSSTLFSMGCGFIYVFYTLLIGENLILLKDYQSPMIGVFMFVGMILLLLILLYLVNAVKEQFNNNNLLMNSVSNVLQITGGWGCLVTLITCFFQRVNHLGIHYSNDVLLIQKKFSLQEKQEWFNELLNNQLSYAPQGIKQMLVEKINLNNCYTFEDLVFQMKNQIKLSQEISAQKIINIDNYESTLYSMFKSVFVYAYQHPMLAIATATAICASFYFLKDNIYASIEIIKKGYDQLLTLADNQIRCSDIMKSFSARLAELAIASQKQGTVIKDLQNQIVTLSAEIAQHKDLIGNVQGYDVLGADLNTLSNILLNAVTKTT